MTEQQRQTVQLCQKAIITLGEENTSSVYLGYQLAVSFHRRNTTRGIITIEYFTKTLYDGGGRMVLRAKKKKIESFFSSQALGIC